MEFFFVIAQNHLLVTLLKSLQNLPNIAKASFLDPCGFFVSFHAVLFYKSIPMQKKKCEHTLKV